LAIFTDFSGRYELPIVRYEYPGRPDPGAPPLAPLGQIRRAIIDAENAHLPVHAMGTAWAFSIPAYCEGVVIDTSNLAGFPDWLQAAIETPDRGRQFLAAVEAGMKVHDLDLALNQQPRPLVLPSHGGAGGQSIAGVVNTGTHGGDAGRPPISDFVKAIVLVGSNGVIRLLQRTEEPVVNFDRFLAGLLAQPGMVDLGLRRDIDVVHNLDTQVFDAALVSVGRFGVVYAYVVQLDDENGFHNFEHRRFSTWSSVRPDLINSALNAAASDEFLQVVVNPVPLPDGDRRCYVTTHRKLRTDRVNDAGLAFGLSGTRGSPELASTPVVDERARPGFIPAGIAQAVCRPERTPELEVLRLALIGIGITVTASAFPLGPILAAPIFQAAAALGRIGPHFRIGDAVTEILNLITNIGHPEVLELLQSAILNGAQSDRRPHDLFEPDRGPWLVHGTRAEICDFYDYNLDCYRADSVEVFFAVDAALPGKVEAIFDVFNTMRARGTPIGAYISLRFMAASRATLGMAATSPTCSVEISMLPGLEGNTLALRLLQQAAVTHGGRVHWGQRNDLLEAAVRDTYGRGTLIDHWRDQLAAIEGNSRTFSTPFTRSHGLEPSAGAVPTGSTGSAGVPAPWASWTSASITAASSPAVLSAGAGGRPLEIFVIDTAGRVSASRRPDGSSPEGWRAVQPDVVLPAAPALAEVTRPVVVRSSDHRAELFVKNADERLWHTYETSPGGAYAGWDTLGAFLSEGPQIQQNPAVAAHGDGRLEVFAQENGDEHRRMLHANAHTVNGAWSAFGPLHEDRIFSEPTATLRRQLLDRSEVTDQILVVAKDDRGPVYTVQDGPGGTSGWGPWLELRGRAEPPRQAVGTATPLAVDVFGPGGRVRVFLVDLGGQVWEILEQGRTTAVIWGEWTPLPPLPRDNSGLPVELDRETRLTAVQPQTLWLFGRTTFGNVMTIDFVPDRGWGTWQDLGGRVLGEVAAGYRSDGRIVVVGRSAEDNALMVREQVGPDQW
jgi:hypothetical protein